MKTILEHCAGLSERRFEEGESVLGEGEKTGTLFVLIEGCVEVRKGDAPVATVREPGALFGEMAILLGTPHTASVVTLAPSRLYCVEDATIFLSSPGILLHVSQLLAKRLRLVNTYVADLQQQFEEHSDHLGMAGEVVERMLHHQDDD
jgi:CRP/FNR family transcriptional regulator, cyclic AMP receptor protein